MAVNDDGYDTSSFRRLTPAAAVYILVILEQPTENGLRACFAASRKMSLDRWFRTFADTFKKVLADQGIASSRGWNPEAVEGYELSEKLWGGTPSHSIYDWVRSQHPVPSSARQATSSECGQVESYVCNRIRSPVRPTLEVWLFTAKEARFSGLVLGYTVLPGEASMYLCMCFQTH